VTAARALREPISTRLRAVPDKVPVPRRLPGLPTAVVILMLMIALAVGLQAQRVSGQAQLADVRSDMRTATQQQAELRASVAEAESPAQLIDAAAQQGMVEPGAVVAVPAPAPLPPDPADER